MLTRSALLFLARQEKLKDLATSFSPFKRMTTRFVAGDDIDETVETIKQINALGCSASFDHLNEGVSNVAETEGEVT
ncbi:MAG: proline dehydrogenase, partial [Pyrinomonadaceae bacterium]